MLYLNNFLGMFEGSAVNSKIVSAALSGIHKTTGAKTSSVYAQPRKGLALSIQVTLCRTSHMCRVQ